MNTNVKQALKMELQMDKPAKEYKTFKHAPVNPNAKPSLALLKLKSERQKKYNESLKTTVPEVHFAPKTEQMERKIIKRNDAKLHFVIREKSKLPDGVAHKEEISPVLNAKENGLDHPDALDVYSSKHKCKHGRHFNAWQLQRDWLRPYCDHYYEKIKDFDLDEVLPHCARCGGKTIKYLRLCGCEVISCTHCMRSFYPHGSEYKNWDKHVKSMKQRVAEEEMKVGKSLRDQHGQFNWNLYTIDSNILDFMSKIVKKPKKQYTSFADKTAGSIDKISRDIKRFMLEEEQPEPKLVQCQGAVASTATLAVGTYNAKVQTLKALLETVKNKLSSFFSKEGTVATMLKKLPKLCYGLVMLYNVVNAFIAYLTKTPLIDLCSDMLLLTSGGHLTAWAVLSIVRKVFVYLVKEDNLENTWAGAAAKAANFNITECIRYWKHLITNEIFECKFSASFKDNEVKFVKPEGGFEMIGMFFSSIPGWFGKVSGKSVLLFCKEILPLLHFTKLTTELGKKLTDTIRKILGFWASDSKEWMSFQARDKDSPVAKLIAETANYYMAYVREEPSKQGEAKLKIDRYKTDLVELARNEHMYDSYVMRFLKDIDNVLSNPLIPKGREHEPFVVKLYGSPGTGKSTSAPAIFGPIFGCKSKQEFDALCYNRGLSEYWDGCRDKPIIVYDDWGQDIKEETDIREFITLVSSAPFMPNFASLVGANPKGTEVTPKLVICCSNVRVDEPKTILSKEALKRRFHLNVLVERVSGETVYSVTGGALVGEKYVQTTQRMSLLAIKDLVRRAFVVFQTSRKLRVKHVNDNFIVDDAPALFKKGEHGYDYVGEEEIDIDNVGKEKKMTAAEKLKMHNRNRKLLKNAETIEQQVHHQADTEYESQTDELDSDDEFFRRHLYDAKQRTLRDNAKEPVDVKDVDVLGFDEIKRVKENSAWLDGWDFWEALIGNTTLLGPLGMYFTIMGFQITFLNSFSLALRQTWRKLAQCLSLSIFPILLSFYFYYKDNKPKMVEEQSSTHKGKEPPVRVLPQSEQVAVMMPIIEKNMMKIRSMTNGFCTNAVFVKGTTILAPEHLFVDPNGHHNLYYKQGTFFEVKLPNQDNWIQFEFDRLSLIPLKQATPTKYDSCDAVLYTLPIKKFHCHRDIVGKFWEGDRILNSTPAMYCDLQNDTFRWVETTITGMQLVQYDRGCKVYIQNTAISGHPGRDGACGNLIMDGSGKTNSPILGIHVAWDESEKKSQVLLINQAMIKRALEIPSIEPPKLNSKHVAQPVEAQGSQYNQFDMEAFGSLKNLLYTPTETSLRKSVLYDKIVEHHTEPAVLSNRDPRKSPGSDLYRDGISKMSKRTREINPKVLAKVEEDMKEFYSQFPITQATPFTLDQVLNGDADGINAIDMTTSAGFPYVLEGLKRTDLFERREDGRIYPKERFLTDYNNDMALLSQKQYPEWYLITSLKDEKRPLAKIYETTKTRLFSVSPMVQLVVMKQFFGPFVSMISGKKVPYVGGLDRQGSSWHSFFSELRKTSDMGFGGDYEKYDGRFPFEVSEVAIRIVMDRIQLTDEQEAQLDTLNYTILHPIYAVQQFLFEVFGTIASGWWITQILGTLGNEIMQRAAWYELVSPEYQDRISYERFVCAKYMSDDNIVSVHRYFTKVFNGVTYAAWCADHDIVYTSADKSGAAKATEPLEEISFLKNTTGKLGNMFTPVMEEVAALEPINWVRKSKYLTKDQATEVNCNVVLRAVFFRGRDYFNRIREKILKYCPHYKLLNYNYLYGCYISYGRFPGSESGEASHYDYTGEPCEYGEISKEEDELEILRLTEQLERQLENTDFGRGSDGQDLLYQQVTLSDGNKMKRVRVQAGKEVTQITEEQDGCIFGTCTKCTKIFRSRNRWVEHLMLHPYEVDPEDTKYTLEQVLSLASIKQLRTWFASLQQQLTHGGEPTCKFVKRLKAENQAYAYYYHIINQVIAWANNGTFDNTKKQPAVPQGTVPVDVMAVIHGTVLDVKPIVKQQENNNEKVLEEIMELIKKVKPQSGVSVVHRYKEEGEESEEENPLQKGHTDKNVVESKAAVIERDGQGRVAKVKEIPAFEFKEVKKVTSQGDDANTSTSATATVDPGITNPGVKVGLANPTQEGSTAKNNLGYTVSDKVNPESTTIRTPKGNNFKATRAELSMNDIEWSLEKMLNKWNQVGVVSWATTDNVYDNLAIFDVVDDLIQNEIVGAPFQNFQNFRCESVVVKLQLTGSKFHQGRVLVGFLPTMNAKGVYNGPFSTKTLIQMGGPQLDPSVGSDLEYEIPWRHTKGFLDLEAKDSLGELYIKVLNKLKVNTGGSTSVQIKVLFMLKGPEFKIPRASALTNKDMRRVMRVARKNRMETDPVMVKPQSGEDFNMNDTSKQEGMAIAPVRAMTGDPAVPHFGEKYKSLRDLGKRYRLAYEENFEIVNGATSWVTIPIETFYKSFWQLAMFLLVRGPLSIKCFLQTVSQAGIPVQAEIDYFVDDDPEELDPLRFADQTALNSSMDVPRMKNSGNGMDIAEFSLPYFGHSATQYQPIWVSNAGSKQIRDYRDTRTVIRRVKNVSRSTMSVTTQWYVAFGDEFTAGIFLGAPVVVNRESAFDHWNRPALRDEDEEDGILVVKQQGLEDIVNAGVSKLIDKVIPDNLVGDVLGLLDRPAIAVDPTFIKHAYGGRLSSAIGPDYLDKMCLDPAAQELTDAEHFGTEGDEMDIQSLVGKRRSLLTTLEWTTEKAVGDVLLSGKIGPMMTAEFTTDEYELSLMDFISKEFKYWRGGITLVFEVVTSMFHEGKLEVTYHPNKLNYPTNYEARVSQYVVSRAIRNTENCFAVTFPYLAETPFKKIWNGQTLKENDAALAAPSVNDFFLGCFTLTVANPLRVSSSVTPTVDINVYVQAAEDFELNKIGFANKSIVTPQFA